MQTRQVVVLLLLFVTLRGFDVMAENWPAYRGPRGDSISNENSAPTYVGEVQQGNAAYATTRVVDNVEVANEYIGPMKWNQ